MTVVSAPALTQVLGVVYRTISGSGRAFRVAVGQGRVAVRDRRRTQGRAQPGRASATSGERSRLARNVRRE